ncbi:MAG: phosphodiester glycosidase family protein [Gemmatimonadales bacterium]
MPGRRAAHTLPVPTRTALAESRAPHDDPVTTIKVLMPLRSLYLVALFAGTPGAAGAQRSDTTATESIVPGVAHWTMVDRAGPWTVNVVAVDLRRTGISIRAARADDSLRGREPVSAIVRRLSSDTARVVAAINADFFDLKTGEAENNQVLDGEVWKGLPARVATSLRRPLRSEFAIDAAGRPLIDTFALAASLIRKHHDPVTIAGVNARQGSSGVTLYTPRFGTSTPIDTSGSVEVPLRPLSRHGDSLVFRVLAAPIVGGQVSLRDADVVEFAAGDTAGVVPYLGDTVTVVLAMHPAPRPLRLLVGGGPRLAVHGTSIVDGVERPEGTAQSFAVVRHPRTGVGISRDSNTVFFITVDGRQESSSGMSLAEFARLMLQVGVYDGLNLDGGGSTTMVIDGRVVNHPSDPGGERAVGNALLVVQVAHGH